MIKWLEEEALLLRQIQEKPKSEKWDELAIGALIIAALEIKKEVIEKNIQQTLQPIGIVQSFYKIFENTPNSK